MSTVTEKSAKAKKPVKTKKVVKKEEKKESKFVPKYQFWLLDEVDKSLFYTGVSTQSLMTNFKQWVKKRELGWTAKSYTAVQGTQTGVKIIRTS